MYNKMKKYQICIFYTFFQKGFTTTVTGIGLVFKKLKFTRELGK